MTQENHNFNYITRLGDTYYDTSKASWRKISRPEKPKIKKLVLAIRYAIKHQF